MVWIRTRALPCPILDSLFCPVLSCGTDDAEPVKPRSFLTFRGVATQQRPSPHRAAAQRACLHCQCPIRQQSGWARTGMDDLQVATKRGRPHRAWVICSGPSRPGSPARTSTARPRQIVSMRAGGAEEGSPPLTSRILRLAQVASPPSTTVQPPPLHSSAWDGKSPRMAASEMGLSCHQPEHSTLVARRSFAQG